MPLHRSDLPPLELLRTFEAAARHLSFTLAAAELFVTQSAVSRQIRALEDDLGTPLFERRHRALALTDAGRLLHGATLDVFERLRDATRRLRRSGGRRSVTVTTTVAFAALWLVPRLPRFTAAHPEVDVRISATNRRLDLARDDIDLAVRFLPAAPGNGEALLGDSVAPVCSPALLRDPARPLREPADLRRHVLLATMDTDSRSPTAEWPEWFEAVGVPGLEPAGTLHFSQYDLLANAAIAGQGVALGRLPLLRDALRRGELVVPFGRETASPRAYYLIPAPHARGDAPVEAFLAWLRAEAAREAVGPGAPEGGGAPLHDARPEAPPHDARPEARPRAPVSRAPRTPASPRGSPRSTARARRAPR
ncbi:MAG TPA: transcriptional regulator GcvA [Burkholderiaceae bacterium]|nr:transcriptional regulator GcvA [Burkholderiaceae bacterium]